MSWYSMSHQCCKNEIPCGAAIVPLDCLHDDKICISETLSYELRDYLTNGWVMHPTHIKVSEKQLDREKLGEEILLNASGIYLDDNMFVVKFESEEYDRSKNLNMLVSSRENRPFTGEEINGINNWSDIKNFSLYCFLSDITDNFSVIL